MGKQIKNAEVKFHMDRMNAAMPKLIAGIVSIRDMTQEVLEDALLAYAYDLNGENEIGCTPLTRFVADVGATKGSPITAIMNYILFCFSPNVSVSDDGKKWTFDPEKSAVRYVSKDGEFKKNKVEVPVLNEAGEPELNKAGNPKTKRVDVEISVQTVRARIAVAKWYDFNSEKPEPAYKGKLINALKKDVAAHAEGKYMPDDATLKFLAAVQSLAVEHGVNLG